MWSCIMPRTYSANETPSWKANAFNAAMYEGGIRTLGSLASNLRGEPNAKQIHQECLTRRGHIVAEKALMRLT